MGIQERHFALLGGLQDVCCVSAPGYLKPYGLFFKLTERTSALSVARQHFAAQPSCAGRHPLGGAPADSNVLLRRHRHVLPPDGEEAWQFSVVSEPRTRTGPQPHGDSRCTVRLSGRDDLSVIFLLPTVYSAHGRHLALSIHFAAGRFWQFISSTRQTFRRIYRDPKRSSALTYNQRGTD